MKVFRCQPMNRAEKKASRVSVIAQVLSVVVFLSASFSSSADSWVFGGRAKVSSIIQWETEGAPTFFQLSTGQRCYVPAEDKKNYALIQMLYATQRTADIHCYPQAYTYGGESAYKLHRIIAYSE